MIDIESEEYKKRLESRDKYDSLLTTALKNYSEGFYDNVYTEIHHIVPKCIGGTNDKSNLIVLSAKEHIIAHILLSEMYPDSNSLKYASSAMLACTSATSERKNIDDLDLLAELREKSRDFFKSLTGDKNPFYGKHHTEKTKKILSSYKKGIPLSEETKQKMSIAHKNNPPSKEHIQYMIKRKAELGPYTNSEETRRKISEANKGRITSQSTREKLSKAHKGKKLSEETKKKLSEINKGRKRGPLSEETKKKLSERFSGKGNPNYGRKFSKEVRERMSESRRGEKSRFFGKPASNALKVVDGEGNIYSSILAASKAAGVSKTTIRRWINKNKNGYRLLEEQ